jgi:dipeptidyl aminopeptidase/acylaminoacyl peptidase
MRSFLKLLLVCSLCLSFAYNPPPLGSAEDRVETLTFALPDGTKLHGYLSLPPQYREGERFPAIFLIPGGKGIDKPKPWGRARSYLKRKEIKEHLRPNYVVLSVEYYSEYFGDPKEFESMSAALKMLAGLPQVDPARIASVGQSHGGYLSLMCVTEPSIHPKPKAAVSVSGVVDLATFVDYMQKEENVRMGFLPQEVYYYATIDVTRTLGWPPDRDAKTRGNYARRSVLTYIPKLQAPILFAHGTGDRVVPFSQAQMLRQALEQNQKTFEFVEIPTTKKIKGHLIFHYEDIVWRKIEAFLKKYL